MKSIRWLFSYLAMAALGLSFAFLATMKFMNKAQSQTPSDLPAVETMQNGSQLDGKGAQTGEGGVPGSSVQGAELPIGEGATASTSSLSSYQSESEGRANYIYNPVGKRDPFKPTIAIAAASTQNRQTEGLKPIISPVQSLDPLQNFDVEQFQIVAIIWDVKNPRAMLKDPEGQVHTIFKNTKIGRAEGRVAAVREGEVVIVESFVDEGNLIKKPRIIELKK